MKIFALACAVLLGAIVVSLLERGPARGPALDAEAIEAQLISLSGKPDQPQAEGLPGPTQIASEPISPKPVASERVQPAASGDVGIRSPSDRDPAQQALDAIFYHLDSQPAESFGRPIMPMDTSAADEAELPLLPPVRANPFTD